MLFQHTLQQTTHDGDTHVGYFNTAVFAVHRQAFPWHPSRSTRGQTTNMTDKSSHGTHFKVNHETDYTTHKAFPWHSSLSIYQGTDYTKMDKSSPGDLLGAPRDRLQICRQAFPWYSSRSTKGQTTPRRTNLLLESFSEHQETDCIQICRQAFPWYTPLEVPRDRLHQEHRSLLLHPF